MGRVWDLDLPHAEAWVLMAIADHADHEGNNAHPGLGLIAWKTGYSRRQVSRIISSLTDKGILVLVESGGGRWRPGTFSIDLDRATEKDPSTKPSVGHQGRPVKRRQNVTVSPGAQGPRRDPQKGVRMSTLAAGKPGHNVTVSEMETMTSGALNHDISGLRHDKDRARINRHEPSLPLNTTHTQNGSTSPVCVSKFPREVCEKYATYLRDTGQGIKNPVGWAKVICRSGEEDAQIEAWLAAESGDSQLRHIVRQAIALHSGDPSYERAELVSDVLHRASRSGLDVDQSAVERVVGES